MASIPTTDHALVAALPETQMLPPPIPQAFESQRYTKQEWETQRPMIEGPWKDFKIKDVVAVLKDNGFYVTERQLKGRIKTWGLGKNMRGPEMKVIVRKQAHRRAGGKETRFRVRGNPVEESKIIRWQKANESYGHTLESNITSPSSAAATPSDISCSTVTPVGSPTPSLTGFGLVQNFDLTDSTTIPSARGPEGTTYQSHLTSATHHSSTLEHAPGELWHFLHDDEEEIFEGRSPAPFSAPATPVPESHRVTNSRFVPADEPDGRDQEQSQHNNFQRLGLSFDASQDASFSQLIAQQGPGQRDITRAVSRRDGDLQSKKYIRYGQKEEEELSGRLKAFEAQHGTTHPATLNTAGRLAQVFQDQCRHRTAESLYKTIARSWHETVGESDPRTLLAFNRLAVVFRLQDKLRKAERLFRRIYAIAQSAFRRNDRTLLAIRTSLAYCCLPLCRGQEAEALARENIRVGSLTLAPNDSILLNSMFILSFGLQSRGEFVEAEKILREVLLSHEISSSSNQYAILQVRELLGDILRQQQNPSTEMFLRDVLRDHARILGPKHTNTLYCQRTLALCLFGTDRREESVYLLKDCVEKSREILGRQSSDTLDFELYLAYVFVQQKEYSKAKAIAEKVSPLAIASLGPAHNITYCCSIFLGECYRGQGDLEKAATILGATLEGLQNTQHPEFWLRKRCSRILEEVQHEMRQSAAQGGDAMFSELSYA